MKLFVYRVEILASEAEACRGDRIEVFEDLEMEFGR
jgi:hypothetical protein